MKYRRQLIALALCLLAVTGIAMAGEDALITLSWLEDYLFDNVDETLDEGLEDLEENILDAAADLRKEPTVIDSLTEAEIDALAAQAADQLQNGSTAAHTLTLEKGQRVTGPLGGGMVLESGSATITSFTGNDLIDVTTGSAAAPGNAALTGHYYLIGADNGCGMTITSDTALVRILDSAYAMDGYSPRYGKDADLLASMGIFRGSNLGFELERVPTRQESLIMLLRLLGEEDEALAYTGTSPFTDLTGWLDGRKYIHYGSAMGYTNGVDATTFNQYGAANRHVYLTYVLRALGYDDKAGDFVWNTTSDDLAVAIGLMTAKELKAMEQSGFYRDHVAHISKNALNATLKDGSMTLGERLVKSGDLTEKDLSALR